jgi:nucleotide-binding universal stress UspA family protein
MSLKDILAFAVSLEADAAVLAAAEGLTQRFDADLTLAQLTLLPEEPLAYEPGLVAGVWAHLLGAAREEAKAEQQRINAHLQAQAGRKHLRALEAQPRDLGRMAALHARYCDLAILARPDSEALRGMRFEMIEGVLLQSGRPALIIPPGWPGARPIGRRPMIAWDTSREAVRALAEAGSFLDVCEEAIIVTVDAKPKTFGHGPYPGANIAAHLERRGTQTEIRNLATDSEGVAGALLTAARECGADLIVMGAFGQSPLMELMFGGATRDVLIRAEIPLLLAH